MDGAGDSGTRESVKTARKASGGKGAAVRKAAGLLSSYVAGKKSWLAGLGLAILSANGLKLANPLVLRSFIDAITAGAGLGELYPKAILFIALALAVQGLALLSTWLGQNLGWMATNDLRMDLLRRVLDMDLAWHKEHLPGELIERVDGDARTLMSFFSDFAIRVAGSALLLAGVLAALFIVDWRIGMAMAAFAVFSSFFLLKMGMVAVPSWKANRAKSAEFFGFVGERIAGREDLRGLGAVPHAQGKLQGLISGWFPARRKANILGYTMWTSSELVAGLGTILSLGLGAVLWRRGEISLGTVFLVYSYADLVRQPLEQLREQIEELQKALAGASRVEELLVAPAGMVYGALDPGGTTTEALSLELRGLSFSYEPGTRVLEDLDLLVPAGSSLGVVGRTGCGKTSLARLALRLYDPDGGELLLGGRPARDYSREWLRRRLAVVTQDVELFSGSLRDNVRLWDPAIGDASILKAFGALGLESWLGGLSGGLGHRVGSGGEGLSAGEAQLLAMVRVFLRDPGLVVLDEASSRLDPATESLIDGAVGRLLEGRTALIIAHRLSTLSRVDRILVMEAGRVVELGDRRVLEADGTSRYGALLKMARAGGLRLESTEAAGPDAWGMT